MGRKRERDRDRDRETERNKSIEIAKWRAVERERGVRWRRTNNNTRKYRETETESEGEGTTEKKRDGGRDRETEREAWKARTSSGESRRLGPPERDLLMETENGGLNPTLKPLGQWRPGGAHSPSTPGDQDQPTATDLEPRYTGSPVTNRKIPE